MKNCFSPFICCDKLAEQLLTYQICCQFIIVIVIPIIVIFY